MKGFIQKETGLICLIKKQDRWITGALIMNKLKSTESDDWAKAAITHTDAVFNIIETLQNYAFGASMWSPDDECFRFRMRYVDREDKWRLHRMVAELMVNHAFIKYKK